ncbi:MAG: hypothetical protein INR64_18680, partial [Caulobacteraceae bacterium]|nr:hypothetical protein [Caulobacter sp.]
MSTPVGTSASVANYASADAAPQTDSTASESGPDAATAASVQAWEKEQQKEARDELQRGIVAGMGQSYAADDDDDSKDAKHSVKQGARKAGVLVTDKGLRLMDHATQSHQGTRRLVDKLKDPNDGDTQRLKSDLQAGNTPDLSFMQKAYAQSPAPSLPAKDVGGGAVANGSNATAAPGGAGQPADATTPAQQDPQAKVAADGAPGD